MVGPPPPQSSSRYAQASTSSSAASSLLPPGLTPTPEEQSLLDMYATVRMYEKEAARLKEQAARDKLAKADERFQAQQRERNGGDAEAGGSGADDVVGGGEASAKKEHKKKRRSRNRERSEDNPASDEEEGDGSEEDESGSDDDAMLVNSDEEDAESLRIRREQKLAKLRDDVALARQSKEIKAQEREEKLRLQHLGEAEGEKDGDVGPALKRIKRVEEDDENKSVSLIRNLEGTTTPPHEFSKKLAMGKANLEGQVVFPVTPEAGGTMDRNWSPPSTAKGPLDGDLSIDLPGFDASQASVGAGNNTLAIKFMAPNESDRFSLNIAGPGHQDFNDVLFHFNPRQHQRGGQLVINDRQEGIWGQGINVPLSTLPLIFGQQSCTLILQITGDGFDVFLHDAEDGPRHCARLEHRTQLPPDKQCSLTLQFPSTDDYGNPENWTVYKVWWGHKDLMAGDLSNIAGVNIFSALHPRKLFVSGLAKLSLEPELDLRRAELERAFRKYGGAQGCVVTVPPNSTFAFVECDTERQADLALTEMQSKYRLNRARRSKHEALQEERAAAEAAKEGNVKESTEWD